MCLGSVHVALEVKRSHDDVLDDVCAEEQADENEVVLPHTKGSKEGPPERQQRKHLKRREGKQRDLCVLVASPERTGGEPSACDGKRAPVATSPANGHYRRPCVRPAWD